tara:strand:+ start:9523 stop:10119 length:597 start_codon:yes stop_codon:yes gene_type:complete
MKTKKKMRKKRTRNKIRKKRTRKVYTKKDFSSNDGMLTSVWGPSLWHTLHVMSFNYPVKPTKKNKSDYKRFINCLRCTLPCGKCRKNLKKNLKELPLRDKDLKNRESFSRWVYNLHELVNKMLNKKSGLTYEQVRERYEHFRSRCTEDKKKEKVKILMEEAGCVKPLYGKKSKCLIRIVPDNKRAKTLKIDKRCIKKR